MSIRAGLVMILSASLMSGPSASAQTLNHSGNAIEDVCSEHISSANLDVEPTPTLEFMVGVADLIVVGRVVEVLPAALLVSGRHSTAYTDSLVSITELIRGKLAPPASTITLNQMGGKVGTCEVVNTDDPIVRYNEEYVLFLRLDKRRGLANTSGSSRYAAVGIWSGKARIVDKKVHFLPAAHQRLHTYDGTDVSVFTELVKNRSRKIPLRLSPSVAKAK